MKYIQAVFGFCIVILSGCVAPITVEDSPMPVTVQGDETVAVSVIESRPYVLSGRKSEQYEGIIHGVYGIPSSFNNMEKKKFSKYLGDRIALGFENAGYAVSQIEMAPDSSDQDFVLQASDGNTERLVSIRLLDWRVDWGGFIVPSWQFFYDLEIRVYDSQARLLTRRNFSGRDTPEVLMNDSMTNNSLLHYQVKFKEFFEDASIVNALKGIPSVMEDNENSLKQRLEHLKEVFEDKLITEEEYEQLRASAIESF